MATSPVDNARRARERLVERRRAIIEDVASVDRVSIDYAMDLKVIQDAIDVIDKVIEEEMSERSDLYDALSGAD
ncbi:hypothetical protein [Microvirga alba]|uniref:Uncharacterized protein n=1 Tax=Microvirga alba TaxID=2791025 RepID=A0A931BK15_9HYPH|nr:hypothetical protein [Microvirga alba]MBF9232651.1 hypothetical protein [Microvirga alba]